MPRCNTWQNVGSQDPRIPILTKLSLAARNNIKAEEYAMLTTCVTTG
jgi:hypothetical protein